MLAAIGIYEFTHNEKEHFIMLKPKQIIFKNSNSITTTLKNRFNFFKFDEEIPLPKLIFTEIQNSNLTQFKILHFTEASEHQYVSRFNDNHIVVLLSPRLIDLKAAYYLARNSVHVFNDAEKKLGFTFEDILTNYVAYMSKDCETKALHHDLEETKKILQLNLNKLIERGELLERTQANVIKLHEAAEEFENEAKKLNRCCGIF